MHTRELENRVKLSDASEIVSIKARCTFAEAAAGETAGPTCRV